MRPDDARGCCNTREGASHNRGCVVFGDDSPLHTYLESGMHLPRIQAATTELATWLGVDAPALTFARTHWQLEDPQLDSICRWAVVTEGGGRHREEKRPQPFRVWPNRYTGPENPGRHACRCGGCRIDRAFVSIVRAYQALDELIGPL